MSFSLARMGFFPKVILTALVYALILFISRECLDSGIVSREVMLGAFWPPLAGMVWGLAGAVGTGLGVFMYFIGKELPPHFLPIGVAFGFISAFLPYRLWRFLVPRTRQKFFTPSVKSLLKYTAVLATSACLVSLGLAFVLYLAGHPIDEHFFPRAFIYHFDFPLMLSLPILTFLAGCGFIFPKGTNTPGVSLHEQVERSLSFAVPYLSIILTTVAIVTFGIGYIITSFMGGDRNILTILSGLFTNILIILHFLFLEILVFFYVMEKRVLNPIASLTGGVISFAHQKEGELHPVSFAPLETKDELELLQDSFADMMRSIVDYTLRLRKITAEKERSQAELDVAMRIQLSLLPAPDLLQGKFPTLGVSAITKPAKTVGGDFYDFVAVDEDHLALAVADVSGKGVPAAFFMTIARTLLHNKFSVPGLTVEQILNETNDMLAENNGEAMFTTAAIGIYEISTRTLIYGNAGHTSPLILHANGEVTFLKKRSGPMLALWPGMKYRTMQVKLSPGDLILFYSDGVTEAKNSRGEFFQKERLTEAAGKLADPNAKEDAANLLYESVKEFAKAAPQSDDITLLAMYVRS